MGWRAAAVVLVAALCLAGCAGAPEPGPSIPRLADGHPDLNGVLLYEFTVSDPSTWTRPWRASLPTTRSTEPICEYACHEENYGLTTILAGARSDGRK